LDRADRSQRPDGEGEAANAARTLDRHVLLCGCGRVGRLIALALEAAKVQYVALEIDVGHFMQAKRHGYSVVFGDASRRRLLEAAGLPRASAIAITFDGWQALEPILHFARERNPDAPVIVSAQDERRLAHLPGPITVLPENLVAGFELATQLLLANGLDRDQVAAVILSVRTRLRDVEATRELSPATNGRGRQ
jgi:CPA2 family monovalent cation:H+ antiporter-2